MNNIHPETRGGIEVGSNLGFLNEAEFSKDKFSIYIQYLIKLLYGNQQNINIGNKIGLIECLISDVGNSDIHQNQLKLELECVLLELKILQEEVLIIGKYTEMKLLGGHSKEVDRIFDLKTELSQLQNNLSDETIIYIPGAIYPNQSI